MRRNTKRTMDFHYTLVRDDNGKIIGGTALGDSGYLNLCTPFKVSKTVPCRAIPILT